MTYTPDQIEAAIAAEAIDWALFFEVTDPEQIEGRRQVMRANVAVDFLKPLLPYLPNIGMVVSYLPHPFNVTNFAAVEAKYGRPAEEVAADLSAAFAAFSLEQPSVCVWLVPGTEG